MDKESRSFDHKQRRAGKEPAELHAASSPPLMSPNSNLSDHTLRGNRSVVSPKENPSNTNGFSTGRGDVSRSHGYSSNRHVRETSKSNKGSPAKGRGHRGAQSALNSAEKSQPAQTNMVPFEVKMTDFPELVGVSLGKEAPPLVQSIYWGPMPPSSSPVMQTSAFSRKPGRRGSRTQPDPQQVATNFKPDSFAASSGQTVVTSWANVASQPPKKPVPKEETISSSHMQREEIAAQHEEGEPGKKKRKKKKKKAKDVGEDAEAESEEPAIYQEPPKFEDEKEFPGLTPACTGTDRKITSSNTGKLCNEENQREGVQSHSSDQSKEKPPAAKPQPTETAKKGQKAEKVSGKKSKVPVQLDIGNMLAALEKKQQSQKAKQDAKPIILSVGGGLPVVQKQALVQKKPPWQQDKIAHNPLDSTSPLVKKGKQREVPKAKKPTPLKKIILKEREERKQRRLLEERGLLPENDFEPANDAAEEEHFKTNATDEAASPTEEVDDQTDLNGTIKMVKEDDEESYNDKPMEQQTSSPALCSVNRPKIHSRKFRDYCNQMLSKDVDECVTVLLKELVRFQDRLYQKDPMKARMKRRIVMGLREVLKHLKLRKIKCVVISPNCERIQSKGGLDEALYNIIDTCREQGVPFVFALSRKALGRCVNKAVPVSLVGIFNYDGAQDFYHKMIELSSEARRAYEVMVSSLEQTGQTEAEQEAEQEVNTEEELQVSSLAEEAEPTKPEEPEYIKIWKKMLEKDCNHKFLNFEEQLRSMRLESECTENTDDDDDDEEEEEQES